MNGRYTLALSGWAACSASIQEADEWREWAIGAYAPEIDRESTLKLPQIKPMLRRRLSPLGKSALWALYQVREGSDGKAPLATLFCSQHGEVARTSELLSTLAEDEPLSPTAFSLSVHNAIGGIFSIAAEETGNISAISAGADTLCAALLEAWTLLQSGQPDDRVQCVIYDAPLPEIYGEPDGSGEVEALALEVRLPQPGDEAVAFSLVENSAGLQSQAVSDQFLRFLLDARSTTLELGADARLWHWSKERV